MENVNGKPADSMSIGSVGSQDGSCGSLETTGSLPVTNCAELMPRVGAFQHFSNSSLVVLA